MLQSNLGHFRLKRHCQYSTALPPAMSSATQRVTQQACRELNASLLVILKPTSPPPSCPEQASDRLYTKNTPPKNQTRQNQTKKTPQIYQSLPGSFCFEVVLYSKNMGKQIPKAPRACKQTQNTSESVAMLQYFKDVVVFSKETCAFLQSPGHSTLLPVLKKYTVFQRTPIYI